MGIDAGNAMTRTAPLRATSADRLSAAKAASDRLSDRDIERINSVRRDHAEMYGTPYDPMPPRAAKPATGASTTSKPVFEDLFTFSGRRNRKSFLLCGLWQATALLALWAIVFWCIDNMSRVGDSLAVGIGLLTAAIMIPPLVLSSYAVAAQRCRDFGWPGWAVLILLIPGFGLVFGVAMLVIPGDAGPNRYGPDPLHPRA
jgi:uncharacterized membrane protein YhaH (DUF805 family)